MQVAEPPAHWLAVLFAGPAAVFSYIAYRKKLPRVILDKNGIVYEYLFKRKSWHWDEVGPFAMDSVHAPKAVKQTYFACAYTTEHRARIFDRSGFRPEADYSKSDIVIPLIGMQDGDDLNSAEDIVDLFNDWRMRFQTPDQTQEAETSTSTGNNIWS